jgi:hypothetical protein
MPRAPFVIKYYHILADALKSPLNRFPGSGGQAWKTHR